MPDHGVQKKLIVLVVRKVFIWSADGCADWTNKNALIELIRMIYSEIKNILQNIIIFQRIQ